MYAVGNTVGSLTKAQKSILLGTLLGDGSLRLAKGKKNALLEVNHGIRQKKYVDWKYQYFHDIVLTPPKMRQGNSGRIAYRFTTRSIPVITVYHNYFYSNGKKVIPPDLVLNPLALAVWFMDDGSYSRNAAYFNTQQFQYSHQKILLNILQQQFGIQSALNSTRLLHSIIYPYLLPEFYYKLGNDPVTTDPKGETCLNFEVGNTPTLINKKHTMVI